MFHWICPECGREIAPTVRDCPVCDSVAATLESALAGEVEAPARPGPVAMRATEPVCDPNSPVAAMPETALAGEVEAPARPGLVAMRAPEPVCDPNLAVAAMLESALAGEVEAPARARPLAARATEPVGDPNFYAPAPPLATERPFAGMLIRHPAAARPPNAADAMAVGLRTPELASHKTAVPDLAMGLPLPTAQPSPALGDDADPGGDLLPRFGIAAAERDPLDCLAAIWDSVQPEPPLPGRAMQLSLAARTPQAPNLRVWIPELLPAMAQLPAPLTPVEQCRELVRPLPLLPAIAMVLRPSNTIGVHPPGAKLLALPVPVPAALLLNNSPVEPAPPLASLGKYSPLEGRPLRPASPEPHILKKECGPRTTLPGPMLTRRLVKFLDRELGPIAPAFLRPKRRLIPAWMATALILGTLLGAGLTSVITVVRPSDDGGVAASASPARQASAAEAGTILPPAAPAVEVTGFRPRWDAVNKPEIGYLVVNHSSARLTGATVKVTLYAADAKAGQAPVCRFQFELPNLAPYQSKEMVSAVEPGNRPQTAPDWRELRAAVDFGQ